VSPGVDVGLLDGGRKAEKVKVKRGKKTEKVKKEVEE
jgi:hypothetical protein